MGIKKATWLWKTNPFTVNILNLINQANPVAITPKYKSDRVDSIVGFAFHGDSNNKDKGSKKITAQNVVEAVTFTFTLFFNLSVKKPPIQ